MHQEHSLMESDEQYVHHLEEIKLKEELIKKKEKEWCEQEYKKYNNNFMKSVANYDYYIAQKKEVDKVTSESLNYLERKLNEGYNRSIIQKEQVKRLAACSLSKIGEVMEN